VAYIRTRASNPPASIGGRRLFETWHLLKTGLKTPASIRCYDTGYTIC